jgi:cell division protein FtsB
VKYVPLEIHLKLQRSYDRLVLWWLAAEKEAKVTDTLWWVEQANQLKQLDAKYKLLKQEYERLSDMVDFLVKKVHHLETGE